VSIVLSTFRNDADVVTASLQSLVQEPAVSSVHVWGYYIPAALREHAKVHQHDLAETPYHSALDQYAPNMTSDALCRAGFKWCAKDSVARVRWRAALSLNMWQVLSAARLLFPRNVLMYTENDAVLIPGRLPIAVGAMRATGSAAASCYRPPGSVGRGGGMYQGSGNVCFLLTPAARPESHLLSYHMVQPADWIMSDYSRGTWPVHKVATHGIPGKAHKSTFEGS